MTQLSVLSIRKLCREGYPFAVEHGDPWVDGQRLYDRVLQIYPNLDDVACLGFGNNTFQCEQIEKLLLNKEADFPNDRRALYICPACRDLGCGALSIRIKKEQGIFVWSDFGVESLGETTSKITMLSEIGPFYFEQQAYEETIRASYGLGGFTT